NLHDADTISIKTFFPERELCCLCRRHGMETHHPVIEDHCIGQLFRPHNGSRDLIWRRLERQVNLGHLVEDAKPSGLGATEWPEGLGEDMLPRVLLQHLQTP